METQKNRFIVQSLGSYCGSDTTTKITLVADTKTGKTTIEVSKEIVQKFDLIDFDNAQNMYDSLTTKCTRVVTLEDLL